MIYNCILIFKLLTSTTTAIGKVARYEANFPERSRLKLVFHQAFDDLILPDEDGVDARLHNPRAGVTYLILRIPITHPLFNAFILGNLYPLNNKLIIGTINHCVVYSKYSEKYLDKLQS